MTDRGPHHRVWSGVSRETDSLGRAASRTNSYVELATGLHYFDAASARWRESDPSFELTKDGRAVARHCQHQVVVSPNLNEAGGAVDLWTPDGKRLRSGILGLNLFDPISGKSLQVAAVRDVTGSQVSSNEIVWVDAFEGLRADVRIRNERGQFHQDVLLREKLSNDQLVKLGFDPESVSIQVWTEFFDTPSPSVTPIPLRSETNAPLSMQSAAPEQADEFLDFGESKMGEGRAFVEGPDGASARIHKQWRAIDDRRFLIENASYRELLPLLESLPVKTAALNPKRSTSRYAANGIPIRGKSEKSPRRFAIKEQSGETLAMNSPRAVLDYVIVSSSLNNYTFQGDTTYYLSGAVNAAGTTTFEGGAVLKYAANASLTLSGWPVAVNWLGAPYRPVILTAKDDDTWGQTINGSTHNPSGYYANPALGIQVYASSVTITNFRIAYAQQAISYSSTGYTFEHGQLVNCAKGMAVGNGSLTMRNVLFANVQYALNELGYSSIIAQNVTFGGTVNYPTTPAFLATPSAGNYPYGLYLTNCILARLTTFAQGSASVTADHNGFWNNTPTPPTFGTAPVPCPVGQNPFQTVGAGNFYLAATSPFRDQGTTALYAGLAGALKRKTTTPPTIQTVAITSDTTLTPQAPRDNDTPDLGYHYDPLDWAVNYISVSAGVHLRLEGGVAIGVYGGYEGLRLASGTHFESVGQPAQHNRITRYTAVQEQPVCWSRVYGCSSASALWRQEGTGYAADLKFTDFYPAGTPGSSYLAWWSGGSGSLSLTDCQVYGGTSCTFTLNAYSQVEWTFRNNLFWRTMLYFEDFDGNEQQGRWAAANATFYNNLFYRGYVQLKHGYGYGSWTVKDNAFDGISISANGDTAMVNSHNGYINTPVLANSLGSDIGPLTSFAYQAGPWGGFYQQPADFSDHGSRSAATAGLSGYTTRPNQLRDTGTVDIGLHYPVLDFSTLPSGFMVNLETTTDGYLRIKPTANTSPLPFITLANSGRGTVSRIEVPNQWNPSLTQPRVVGEYYTAPSTLQRNPSRTTVDRYGNVWVGNRNESGGNAGSVAEFGVVVGGTRGIKSPENAPLGQYNFTPDANGQWILPPTDNSVWYSTCIDRDRDGLVRTSAGLATDGSLSKVLGWVDDDDPQGADPVGGVSQALDEMILRYVRVSPTFVRSIAVDRQNNIWVGSDAAYYPANGWQDYIDCISGSPITGYTENFGSGGYGGLVDGYGTLWSAGWSAGGLLRFLPTGTQPMRSTGGIIPSTSAGYGLGIDPKTGDVWLGNHVDGTVWRFSEGGCREVYSINAGQFIRGIVVDGHENVWVAKSEVTPVVYHLRTTGEFIGEVSVAGVGGNHPYGLCVDSEGMVWAICNNGYAVRIDPNQNPPIGLAVKAVYLGDLSLMQGPYNYSDMSGFVTLGTTKPAGFCDFIKDSSASDCIWVSIGCFADTPQSSEVLVEVRAANAVADLPSWPFRAVGADGVVPSGMKGRYLEVRATLMRDFCPGGGCAGPELQGFYAEAGGVGSALKILNQPRNLAKKPGENDCTFAVSVDVPPGTTVTYQWRKDGNALSNGGKFSGADSAALEIDNVQYTDAGSYAVRVTDSTGTVLESAAARLHIKGNLPVVPDPPVATPASPNPGDTVTLTASASVSSASVPTAVDDGYQLVSYQWRHGQTPIPGATGTGLNASFTINNFQCEDAGDYSVVFGNPYGQALSPSLTVSVPGSLAVTVSATVDGATTPLPVTVNNENQRVILTAGYCIEELCKQWYLTMPGGTKTKILGATDNTYEIPRPLQCGVMGDYTFEIIDNSWNVRQAVATVAAPLSIASVILELNPSGGGTWTYVCEEYDGTTWAVYGLQNQNSLVMPTGDSSKRGHLYRVTAEQGATVAKALGSLDQTDPSAPIFRVLDVQNATADVTYTANPQGIGPWHYQWYEQNQITGQYDAIPGAEGRSFEISQISCEKQGTYLLGASTDCGGSSQVSASLFVESPSVTMASVTLELNPDGGGVWTYACEEFDGVGWSPGNPPNQNSLIIPTTDSTKLGHLFRITAAQGETTASVLGTLEQTFPWSPSFHVQAVQRGTADVRYTAASPIGVGPWTYQWFKDAVLIPGATDNSYEISAVDCSKQGTYQVRISDSCVASATADGTVTCP